MNDYVVQLVFPATREWIKLELHVGIHGRILVIEINDQVSIHDSESIHKFFCVLYGAIHYLITNPIKNEEPCVSLTQSIFFIQLSITGGTLSNIFER